MRARTFSEAVTLVTAGSIVTASPAPHKHHKHAERLEVRIPANVETVNVPGPTIVAYELNGQLVKEDEVCKGMKDGSLKWAEGTEHPLKCPTYKKSPLNPTPTTLAAVVVSNAAPATSVPVASTAETQKLVNQEYATKQSATPASEIADLEVTPTAIALGLSQQSISTPVMNSDSQDLDKDFPDGTIDCSTFPSDYGPIKVDWTKLGGWTGIQYVSIQGNSIIHIDTAVPGGEGCRPGAMCSYACPAGYQKSQWPSTQGSTGQSVGGLHCKENGKLSLTNPSLSKKLCIRGTGATTVQNKLSSNAAICRTDYPGT
ncbi:MAG: hypothetical protein Q9217_004765 [Psora testacea]